MPKILIIDDDFDMVEAMKVVLESKGYAISHAENGKKGIEILKTEKPDLIILDVMMEKQGAGFDVSREIKNDPHYKNTPILMLTAIKEKIGFDFSKESQDKTWLPVDDYAHKPIQPDELLSKVERLIKGD